MKMTKIHAQGAHACECLNEEEKEKPVNRSNLALQDFDPSSIGQELSSERKRSLMVAPRSKTENRRYMQEKTQYKNRAHERARRTIQVVLCIAAISAMLTFSLFSQSKVVEMNFANAQLQNAITKAQIINVQKQSEIVQLTDLEAIRSKAILLGFQEPGPEQIIYLAVPKKDRLVLRPEGNEEESAEVSPIDEAAFKNLEGFFRTLQP